jgi:hypothetical protein
MGDVAKDSSRQNAMPARTHPGTENWPWAGEMPDSNLELVTHVRVDLKYPSLGKKPLDYMYLRVVQVPVGYSTCI